MEWFHHFVGILFSRNLAYAKFRENKTLLKISEFTVLATTLLSESLMVTHHYDENWNLLS